MTTLGLLGEVGPRRVLPLFLGALILMPTLSSTAVAAPMKGVTVLVHGFVLSEGDGNTPFDYWGGNNGENFVALLKRFGSGKVWQYIPGTGHYQDITTSIPGASSYNELSGHHILLFDWREGSNEPESGQAEAAADALSASLIEFHPGGQPTISISPYAAVRPLHFIGHSRGTVVVSETVQRLGRYNIRVHYVTYLDIHDFGQPLIDSDEYFHDPAVQVWENVDYVDAVYQENPATMCIVNPAGRPLGLPFPLERNLTTLTALHTAGLCALHSRPHAWIKDYYWGTVATNGPSVDRPADWYMANGGNGTGIRLGFDLWWRRGGFEQGPEPSLINRARCVVASDAEPYTWSPPEQHDNGDRNDVPPVLFNGEFELPHLDRGIGGTKTLAGWRYFGGGGNADVGPPAPQNVQPNNSYLVLTDSALQARHNRFFLPLETRELLFGIRIASVPPLGTHILEVRFGSDVIRAFTIANVTSDFVVYAVPKHLWDGYRGRVDTLSFVLVTSGSTATPEIRIDNINFVTEPVSWIHAFYRTNASNWRLIWRSWPDATFRVQSSSNFATWRVVDSSSAPSASGSFNIPHSGAPQVYFRGEAVPAR